MWNDKGSERESAPEGDQQAKQTVRQGTCSAPVSLAPERRHSYSNSTAETIAVKLKRAFAGKRQDLAYMRDYRSLVARAIRLAKSPLPRVASWARLVELEPAASREVVQREPVKFFGCRPGVSDSMEWREERRLEYVLSRPGTEDATNTSYSPSGAAWCGGRLIERFSAQPLRPRDLFSLPPRSIRDEIDECQILEIDHIYTYGDWVHGCLGPILTGLRKDLPLLLPRHLADKTYVRRDLEGLRISPLAARDWTKIRRARVVRKQQPYFYWSEKEVRAFLSAFKVSDRLPEAGSLLYLGRFSLVGEVQERKFPSEVVAELVSQSRGVVVPQEKLTTTSAGQYWNSAETVIGDHGSGLLNILFWKPRTVIELVVNDWWVNNTLFVANVLGVKNFGVVAVDGLTPAQVKERINLCLREFGCEPL